MEKPYLIEFKGIGEEAIGYLSVAENSNLPFRLERVYWVYGTPVSVERGNHAHKKGRQVLIATAGTISITLENQHGNTFLFELCSPQIGLYVPEMYWRKLNFKPNSVCMCLASTPYDENDYIFDYKEFKKKTNF